MIYRKLIIPVLAFVSVSAMVSCALFEDKHVAKGRQLFEYYCSHCHGASGQGNGYNAVNLDPRPRDLTDRSEPYMAESTNEQIFRSVKEGVAGAYPEPAETAPSPKEPKKNEEDEEAGSPLMPYWGYTFSEDEIWDLVAFIRTLHKNDADKIKFNDAPDSPTSKKPALSRPQAVSLPNLDSPEGEKMISEGKHLYEAKYSCSGCHRIMGKGGQVGPDLSRSGFRLNPGWMYQWIQYPQSFRSDTKMPAFNMPENDVKAIVMYLRTLQATSAEAPGPPSGKGPT